MWAEEESWQLITLSEASGNHFETSLGKAMLRLLASDAPLKPIYFRVCSVGKINRDAQTYPLTLKTRSHIRTSYESISGFCNRFFGLIAGNICRSPSPKQSSAKSSANEVSWTKYEISSLPNFTLVFKFGFGFSGQLTVQRPPTITLANLRTTERKLVYGKVPSDFPYVLVYWLLSYFGLL